MQGSRRWTSHCIFLCPTSCGIVGHKPDQEMPGKWTIDQLLDKQIIFFFYAGRGGGTVSGIVQGARS